MPTRFTWCFFSTKYLSPARELLLLLLCLYSRMIRVIATKDARWVRWSPCSLDPSPRRPTARCSLAAVRREDSVRASWLYSLVVHRIDRYSCSYFCVCLVLLLYHAGSAQLDLYFGLVAKICIYKGSGRAGARGPRPSSVKDDLRRQGHSEKKKPYQVRRCGVLR